jgi:hypothetical protein
MKDLLILSECVVKNEHISIESCTRVLSRALNFDSKLFLINLEYSAKKK